MEDGFFRVEQGRFHLKDKNIYILRGWFANDNAEDSQIKVLLDKKELEFKVEIYEGIEIRQRYLSYDANISKEYIIYINLPFDFNEYKKLRVYLIKDSVIKLPFLIKVKSLLSAQKQLEYCIDNLNYTNGKYTLTGWVASCNDLTYKGFIKNNVIKDMKIEKYYRRDVIQVFKEAEIINECAFKIEIKADIMKKIKLIISDGERESTYIIYGGKTNNNKKIKQNKLGVIYRGILYLKNYGIKKVIKKIKEKVIKDNYENWYKYHKRSRGILELQKKENFKYEPKFSIVIPLYKTPTIYFKELMNSLITQTYSNWEICLSDGSGKDTKLTSTLEKYSLKDTRIKYVTSDIPLGISENTNKALALATGDYIALVDHDDLVTPDALYELVKAINLDFEIDVIYSDEDKVAMDGKTLFAPHFKSDYNLDLLRSMNYICHLFVVKKQIIDQVGGFLEEYDGAQDYDFIFRCTEKAKKIHHIPRILYHWRAHIDSTAESPESKLYAFESGKKAIEDHYSRVGIKAKVFHGPFYGLYRTKYEIKGNPLISIIIPNKDHIDDLEKCIYSIESKSKYRNFEFIIVENNSTQTETFEYYKKLELSNPKVKVVYYKGDFNYSSINNYGSDFANGEFILLLNNDTEIINQDCLEEMLGYCSREDVGIVGARLYYEDDTIQHAGVVMGFGGIAGHTFVGASKYDIGYFSRIICAQNYSAVTAACMMTKKSIFKEIGGLSTELKVAFNDIDYCMKVREIGKLVVYNPYAELYHYESKSRGLEDTPEKMERFNNEIAIFREKWKNVLKNVDPYYNVNLTLEKADFSLKNNKNSFEIY